MKGFEQEVTPTTCEFTDKGNEDMARQKNIGWIHSHNTMDVFLSGTDVETATSSGLSLCVNNELDFHGKLKTKLPCGFDALIDVKVEIQINEDSDITQLADELVTRKQGYVVKDEGAKVNFLCRICDTKVSKKKGTLLNGQVVHKKCLKKYGKEFEESGGVRLADYEDEDYARKCDDCENYMPFCQCYEKYKNNRHYSHYTYLVDYMG